MLYRMGFAGLAALLLAAPLALAQGTATVVATQIIDASGAALARGTVCFTPVDAYAAPAAFMAYGGGNVLPKPVCRAVLGGVMQGPALALARSDKTTPVGINYQIVVTDGQAGTSKTLGVAAIAPSTGNIWDLGQWTSTAVQTAPPAAWVVGPPGVPGVQGPQGPAGVVTNASVLAALTYTPLSIAGGTLTGPLTLAANPTSALQAATKQYTDAAVANLADLPLAGGAMTGPVVLAADPASPLQAATKHYADTAVATALPLAGGSMMGQLNAQAMLELYPHVDATLPQFGTTDATGNLASGALNQAAFQAAINVAKKSTGANLAVYIPPGVYAIAGTLDLPNNMQLYSDSSVGATLLEATTGTAVPLVRVRTASTCNAYACYGGISHLTLAGQGAATIGSLLELDSPYFLLNDLHMFNHGGRGLQTNGAAERIVSYGLTVYQVRWPIVLAGEGNETYFFKTDIIEAGQVQQGGLPNNRYCYSVNCTAGAYAAAGTVASPTTLVSDPHASVYIDKGVNVAFIGGSFKAQPMIAGAKVYVGGNVRFENIYHENPDQFGPPTNNKAYIIGGKSEQTYLTGTLAASGLVAPVKDASWMPQFFGSTADLQNGDYHAYALAPQDYNPGDTTASAYVSGLKRGQFEVVNGAGFTADGNFNIQPGGRNIGGNAPTGIVWPSGTVVEQWAGNYGMQGDVVVSQAHINMVQGTPAQNGWSYDCEQTNYRDCGEIEVGYAPDVVAETSNPATNLTGIVSPLGTAGSAEPSLAASLTLDDPQMFNGGAANPYIGTIVAQGYASITLRGTAALGLAQDAASATTTTNGAVQLSLNELGGGTVYAPLYATGTLASVTVTDPAMNERWTSASGWYQKQAQVFEPYQQYGQFMNGLQYQNENCVFDLSPTGGTQSASRWCLGGGPANTNTAKNAGPGYGYGAEWDFWTGTGWFQALRAYPGGLFTAGAFSAAQILGDWTVDGITYPTLAAVWAAAAAAATSTGQAQTIRLGPGNYPVTAPLVEPTNGACVSLIGSAGTTTGADIANVGTSITLNSLPFSGGEIVLGNTTLTEGCTFRNFTLNLSGAANSGLALQWYRGLLVENVMVNDPSSGGTGFLLGETSGTHQAVGVLRNVAVSVNAANYSPLTRPLYGVEALPTAIDSLIDGLTVRNVQTAAFENQGGGWTTHAIHGFGYPYSCTTAPCSNQASSSSAANASFATSYEVEDNGTGGNVYSDTYIDSPAIAGFHVEANGVQINGGHIQWPDTVSFPAANLADVEATVTSNLIVTNIDCLNMSGTAGIGLQAGAGVWISFQGTGSVPPSYSTFANLAGCGDYYQDKSGASQTAFERGSANYYNTDPGVANGMNPKVWASPLAGGANYAAFAAQLYTGYLGDEFMGGFSGQPLNFHVDAAGSLLTRGGLAVNSVSVTAAASLTSANENVLANASSGAFTLTLPSCYTALADGLAPTGMQLEIAKTDSSANAVTLATVSSQTINVRGVTATAYVLNTPGTVRLGCGSDANWYAFAAPGAAVTASQMPAFTGDASSTAGTATLSVKKINGQTISNVPRMTWNGGYTSVLTTTGNSNASVWKPSSPITITRLDVHYGTAAAGCTTYPVVGVYDSTAAAWIATQTVTSGSYTVFSTQSANVPAGNQLNMGTQTAAAGCTTSPAAPTFTVEYVMQ